MSSSGRAFFCAIIFVMPGGENEDAAPDQTGPWMSNFGGKPSSTELRTIAA